MIYTLENELLRITAATYGGELHSITGKQDGTEYLWDGNPAGWKYHAPVLFPLVGKVVDGAYRIDGKTYRLPQHGLARTREFAFAEQTENSLCFRLTDSEDTLAVYPYRFILENRYTLSGDTVTVSYTVTNRDDKPIFFCIGSHPAFFCPLSPDEALTDWSFAFEKEETASVLPLNESGYLRREPVPYLDGEREIPLTGETFAKDALIFERLSSKTVTLASRNRKDALTVDFHEFPFLGLWAPANGARFVCIEPWEGHADYEDFTGDFREKEDVLRLPVGERLTRSFTIRIQRGGCES